ncbi:MAG: hypothetical protein ACI8PT_000999 [Gammaproteobacteria bacterium]|jgi:hypothetical protein
MLRFASSQSDSVNSAKAMQECLDESLASLGAEFCDLLVIHATVGHSFKGLLEEARKRLPNAEIIGCSANGIIGRKGASERMRSLAIMAVSGTAEFSVAWADSIRGATSFDVSAKAATQLKSENDGINIINVLASGIDIAADQVIAGIESVFGSDVSIIGGTSSDNMKALVSYQLAGDHVLERGIVLLGFSDPTLALVAGGCHGSVPVGQPFEVTAAEDNRVDELDGQPAWPTLMDRLGLPAESDAGSVLVVSALGQEVPAESADAYGNSTVIHTIFKVSDDHQSLYLPASCPVGAKLWLMQRDEEAIFEGTDSLVAAITEKLKGRTPVAVFQTDCAARGRMMFNKIAKDEIIARMQEPIMQGKGVPWLGLYGFGEFTPVHGTNHFHTQTSSIYALVRKD